MSAEDLPEPLRIVVVGQADHGKSTLIGRLLNDAGALPDETGAKLTELSRKRGLESGWSFVTDALQAERDRGITIDMGGAVFRTERRSFVIIDAPGHQEFLRNMVTGAASADLAVAVVDASQGALDPFRRHLHLLALLGVRRLIVTVNKMDKAGYDSGRFGAIAQQIRDYLRQIDLAATAIIPIAARNGEMVAERSANLAWYHGPTLLEALDRFETEAIAPDLLPLRFSVQDVYKFDERRILAGRVESGVLRVGDMLAFAPGGATAKVASIEDWNQPLRRVAAAAGDAVGITLDERIFVERGNIAAPANEPIRLAGRLKVRMFWLGAETLAIGRSLTARFASGEYPVVLRAVEGVIDLGTLERRSADRIGTNEIGEAILEAPEPIPVDRHAALPRTGRAVLTDGNEALGGAVVLDFAEVAPPHKLVPAEHGVSREERERRNRHRGGVLWLTGLPGSGKSTLALALERALFEGGMNAFVLDGDSMRRGLSQDLGFDPLDRAENVRRVAEAARLLAESGHIAIAALISPMATDRARARAIVGAGFAEIYVKADIALCEARDPKGFYARARHGEIKGYTGVDAPYEEPDAPDLVIDTGQLDITEAVDRLIGFVETRFHDPRIDAKAAEPDWSV
jgi:bifunctional enzyme CysN/CysC